MKLTALQSITYGLYVIGVYSDGRPAGCIINTCFQVTSANPVLAICLNKNNFTLDALRHNPRFSISIIAEDTDPSVIGKFGFCSSRDNDKYADFGFDDMDGAPAVRGSFSGRIIADAFDFVECDTHVVVLGRMAASYDGEGTPMTYSYYHRVIKGSAPKSAPTYSEVSAAAEPAESGTAISESAPSRKAGKHRYQCDVCGYIVECDGELPDVYVCPLCGVDRSHFFEI